MTATYTLPRLVDNYTSSHPGVSTGVKNAEGFEEGTVYHNYYQWVCLLLAVQACVCYMPYAAWKMIEGGRVGVDQQGLLWENTYYCKILVSDFSSIVPSK